MCSAIINVTEKSNPEPEASGLPHTTLAFCTDNTKILLEDFAINKLQPALDTHPLLSALLSQRLTDWVNEVRQLPDAPASPGTKPSFDTYVPPALVQQNKKAAEDYFSALDFYGFTLEEGTAELQNKAKQNAEAKKSLMQSANHAYELGDSAYQAAVRQWEDQCEDHPRLKSEYQKLVKSLRDRLNLMVKTFNTRSKYDEDLESDEMETFVALDYQSYRPTRSFFNNAAGGTLYYDFSNNSFQLHIHCQMNATKASAVRIKRYGQQVGLKRDGAWGMVEHFMTKYPPNWTSTPRRC
jgi:hypothetical protein